MADHRKPRPPLWRSRRLRAVLSLGVVAVALVAGTYAYWTDDVTITGTSFTAGTLDLQVNGSDAYTTTTLGMSSTPMVPGNTSAEVLTVKNNGTVPLKYTITGGLGGTDAAAFSTAAAIKLTIVSGGTRTGTGNAATCTGGTTIFGPTALTNVTSTAIIGTRRGPLAAAGTEALCFQITFDAAAPSTLQGKTATATFTATGTSDVS
ncbi:MAG TPA: TasA family protein [Marmoricola sp.]|nr:TasA family protein [Marmoricola sp.]